MAAKVINIMQLSRWPSEGSWDELNFTPGVNVIVGRPNTGKSQWLKMLDYLMGDKGSPDNAFEPELAQKYEGVEAVFAVDGKEIVIQRRWKEKGLKSKILVNEKPMDTEDFSSFLLEELGIPSLNFPSGNPFSNRSWPALSWRELFRHIYRHQNSWSDIASKQPAGTQHACLMMFTGIAPTLFSEKYEELVATQKELYNLENAKQQFLLILDRLSKELLDADEIGIAVTAESIDAATQRYQQELEQISLDRSNLLQDIQNQVNSTRGDRIASELSEEWAGRREKLDKLSAAIEKSQTRFEELEEYRSSISSEINRLTRAKVSAVYFSDFKITHCPACHKQVRPKTSPSEECYVCGQPNTPEVEDNTTSEKRIDFELEQLQDEQKEITNLLEMAKLEVNKLMMEKRLLEEELAELQNRLRPIQDAAAAIIPPSIQTLNVDAGRVQERIRQLERIKAALDIRQDLSKQIDELSSKVRSLEGAVDQEFAQIDFDRKGDILSDQMTQYLNRINQVKPGSWSQGRVTAKLRERYSKFMVDGRDWSSTLGGTLTIYFLLAYSYALVSLTPRPGFYYPGLCILDLPAKIESGDVYEAENFILQPFIELTKTEAYQNSQVIIAGNSFQNLGDANRIELTRVWRQESADPTDAK